MTIACSAARDPGQLPELLFWLAGAACTQAWLCVHVVIIAHVVSRPCIWCCGPTYSSVHFGTSTMYGQCLVLQQFTAGQVYLCALRCSGPHLPLLHACFPVLMLIHMSQATHALWATIRSSHWCCFTVNRAVLSCDRSQDQLICCNAGW